jgi:F420-non-reducing hydrogenase small subunit
VVGVRDTSVCEQCPLVKEEKKVLRFYRPYEIVPDGVRCLLEQGLICMGPATRAGCGALCPQVNAGCRGCYGPVERGTDQGARMLSALASILDVGGPGAPEEKLDALVDSALDTLADPAGTFYRFSMSSSLLKQAKINGINGSNGHAPGEVEAEISHEENQH